MDSNPAQQAFKELLPYLETLETQTAAILRLLKDKGLTTDEQFAPYLEQAGNISNVKWLAAGLRIDHLLSSVEKDKEEARKTETSSSEASARQERSKRDEEDRETEGTVASSENQRDTKSNSKPADTKPAQTKQGAEQKDNAKQEKIDNSPPAKSRNTADNHSEQGADKQTKKETNSNSGTDRDTERDTEKKAS